MRWPQESEARLISDPKMTLQVQGLEIWRGERCLIADLHFRAIRGQLVLITGPNGAGKTTLLRVLAGLSPPTAGHVGWDGADMHRLPAESRRNVAYHGHLEALKKHLTVMENLTLYRELWASACDLGALLEEVGMQHAAKQQIRHLSAGQRRRVALATLRVRGAPLWILDEPTTNLDEQGRRLASRWVGSHLEAGGVAVVATHQPDDLARPGALVVEL
jgi:heme exporter protein A